jgi:hypothetical protein
MVVFLAAACCALTALSPLGILQAIPYAKNAPLGQLMHGKTFTFPFRKS